MCGAEGGLVTLDERGLLEAAAAMWVCMSHRMHPASAAAVLRPACCVQRRVVCPVHPAARLPLT